MLEERGELTAADFRLADQLARQQGATELRAVLDLGLLSDDALADRLVEHLGAPRFAAESDTDHEPAAQNAEDAASAGAALPPERSPGDAWELSAAASVGFMRASGVLLLRRAGELDPTAALDVEAHVRAAGDATGAEADETIAAARVDAVVLSDPSDHHVTAAVLTPLLHDPPSVFIATRKRVEAFLDRHADDGRLVDADGEGEQADLSADLAQLRDMASEAPVIRYFNQTIERAMELGASDVHLERFERDAHLRMRVDGILHDQPAPAPNLYEALLTRLKIMAGLDIAERRRAQDGRVRMRLRGRNVDMRVSIVPTMYGQDAAIRLQDREKLASVSLTQLGFTDAQIDALDATAAKSHGILLITGPTGSGKTTTLYAILRKLASTERKVMTVEDPVEYAMPGVNQVPVNPAINLTFANTLRHLLRHDPDVILVGEIRDAETAQMAFQASLTGHMVLSTLHTNDVPSSFVRLVDMGVEPYLVNAAIEGVSAQRLLRKLDRAATRRAGEAVYRGRVAVMEFSPVTAAVKRCMLEGAEEQSIRRELLRDGFEPMRVAAERLVREGVTDEAEVARVLGAAPRRSPSSADHAIATSPAPTDDAGGGA